MKDTGDIHMINTQGMTMKEWTQLKDIVTKANTQQVTAMVQYLKAELSQRDSVGMKDSAETFMKGNTHKE